MTDFNTWLKEQREIESKGRRENLEQFDYMVDAAEAACRLKIAMDRNYRNMLDALEIAVKALSTITLTENDAADVYVNYRRDVTLKQIKEKLGVTE